MCVHTNRFLVWGTTVLNQWNPLRMRMSSLAKKGDKGKSSNPSFPQSKDMGAHQTSKVVTKSGDTRNTESGKATDQINPKLLVNYSHYSVFDIYGN